ncbi:MAG: S8/S53 family peptidase [Acidobacteriota bacterium]
MTTRIWCWFGFGVMVLVGSVARGESTAVEWRRLACPQPFAGGEIRCGQESDGATIIYQVATAAERLSPGPVPGCRTGPIHSEVPRAYPSPAMAPRSDSPLPCDQGSCLCDSAAACDCEWIALVDWNHWHGWSLASLMDSVAESEVGVVLFDLEAGIHGLPTTGANDLGVLARLCQVLEVSQSSGPPLAVNMSFGRLATSKSGLGDEISAALERLSDHGVTLLASAGNHRELLFPAASETVLAVGSLALPQFLARQSVVQSSWETPPAPWHQPPGKLEALFPSSGLCYSDHGVVDQSAWLAPPGSSYATAMATGWLALAHRRGALNLPFEDPGAGLWHPIRGDGDAERFLLARDGAPIVGSESPFVDAVLAASSDHDHPCWRNLGLARASLGACSDCSPSSAVSLVQLVDDLYTGTPETNACVPCTGDRPPPVSGADHRLVLNLAATPPLPEGLRPTGLQLRVGERFHDLQGSDDLLGRLRLGAADPSGVEELVIEGIAATDDLSLLFLFADERFDGGSGGAFWTSTPIHLPESPRD